MKKRSIWQSEVRFFQFSLWWLAFIPCLFTFTWYLGISVVGDLIKNGSVNWLSHQSVVDDATFVCKYYLMLMGGTYGVLAFLMLFLSGLRNTLNGVVDYVFTNLPMWDNDAKATPSCHIAKSKPDYINDPRYSMYLENIHNYHHYH